MQVDRFVRGVGGRSNHAVVRERARRPRARVPIGNEPLAGRFDDPGVDEGIEASVEQDAVFVRPTDLPRVGYRPDIVEEFYAGVLIADDRSAVVETCDVRAPADRAKRDGVSAGAANAAGVRERPDIEGDSDGGVVTLPENCPPAALTNDPVTPPLMAIAEFEFPVIEPLLKKLPTSSVMTTPVEVPVIVPAFVNDPTPPLATSRALATAKTESPPAIEAPASLMKVATP